MIHQFGDFELAKQNVIKNSYDVLMANYTVWPFMNFINFRYLPIKFRMLGLNICAVFWNVYLAWKNQRDKHKASD